MSLVATIRAVIAALVLVTHSPVGGHVGPVGLGLFVGRFTRVAAAQQFDPTRATEMTRSVLGQVSALDL